LPGEQGVIGALPLVVIDLASLTLAGVLFMASFLVIGIAEIVLARSSANGTLAVGNIELARVSTAGGHVSGRANLSALTVLAILLAAPLTWAARRRRRH
jgi:hypothetical protein